MNNTVVRGSQEHYELMERTVDLMGALCGELQDRAHKWSKEGDYKLWGRCQLHALRMVCSLKLHDSL